MEFRLLRADEIECRPQKDAGDAYILLLYKDARCDQNILDETVGPLNWQRHHSRDNANCIVSIWDENKGRWIEKEDTGSESNVEKEKGLASDSFKRACFNWGIGRELYTAPKMFFPKSQCKDKYDRFEVTEIKYSDRRIYSVKVRNTATGYVKEYTNEISPKVDTPEDRANRAKVLNIIMEMSDADQSKIAKHYNVTKLTDLTLAQCNDYMRRREAHKEANNE